MAALSTEVVFMAAASMPPRTSKAGSIPAEATFIPTPALSPIHRGTIRNQPAAAATILTPPMADTIRIPRTGAITLIPAPAQNHILGGHRLRPLAHIGLDTGVQLQLWHGARRLQQE